MAYGDVGGAVTELVVTCQTPASGSVAFASGDAVKLTGAYTVDNATDAEDEVFGAAPGGYEEALPPGNPETVFTRSGQSEAYDVIQYSVKLVMDARDIPALVDRICKNSFHTLLRISYEAVPVNRKMVGKVYGSGPVVNVVLDFETILLGEVFRPLLPEYVCEEYDIDCPERIEEEEGD